MIRAELMLDDDRPIATVYMRLAPRVGECLWIAGEGRERVKAAFGASSFRVKLVAHWVAEGPPPRADTPPIHSLAVYVEPVTG